MKFLTEQREKVRAENPELSFPEVTKLLGAQWSKLSSEEKQVRTCMVLSFFLFLQDYKSVNFLNSGKRKYLQKNSNILFLVKS